MIKQLKDIIDGNLKKWIWDIREWDSLVINKRVPHTYRAFKMLPDGNRLCLHKFTHFDKDGGEEAFMHPHPWPAAFTIVMGEYEMKVGYTLNRTEDDPRHVLTTRLSHGSSYEITSPLTWHSITPITASVHTIMLNGKPWDSGVAHTAVRTTKGKDLDKMTRKHLTNHLSFFNHWLYNNHTWDCIDSPTGFCQSVFGDIDSATLASEDMCVHCGEPMDERK